MGLRPRAAAETSTGSSLTPAICGYQPEMRYAISNRNAILCIGSSCPGPLGSNLGRFRIDSGEKRASLRFTSPAELGIRAIWIYAVDATAQGRTRVTLADDEDGLPSPAPTPSSVVLRMRPGWQRVELPAGGIKKLRRCQVYHVLIAPDDPQHFGAHGLVELVTTVSRFPVPWQPRVPGSDGLNPFLDLELAFLFQDSKAGLLARWEANHFNYGPIFALETTGGSAFGQPYNELIFPVALGEQRLGQRIPIPSSASAPIPVNYVAVFSERLQQYGTDRLFVDVHDEAAGRVLASAQVIGPSEGVINRAHWFGGAIAGGGIELLAEHVYSFLLRSDNGGANPFGHELAALRSTLLLPAGVEDPTYGGSESHVVLTPDGGRSFFPHAGRPDTPILLAQRADPGECLCIYDEGGVYHANNTAALTATPGEPLRFTSVLRNIGSTPGDLFVQLVDVASGAPLTPQPLLAPSTGPNRDAQGVLAIVNAPVTRGRWRIDFRCGHVSPSAGRAVVDDVVRYEVRVS